MYRQLKCRTQNNLYTVLALKAHWKAITWRAKLDEW
jgi:hypothetical protein